METRYIKIWNAAWNLEVSEPVRSIDGVDLHDAHVHGLKEELYSFISDVSKSATGCRMRYDISTMSVAELEELCEYWGEQSEIECRREEERQAAAVEDFEASIARIIDAGAGDRETALRWFRDAHHGDDEFHMGDESIRFDLGLPWDYDLDHGDRDFFKRQAAKAA